MWPCPHGDVLSVQQASDLEGLVQSLDCFDITCYNDTIIYPGFKNTLKLASLVSFLLLLMWLLETVRLHVAHAACLLAELLSGFLSSEGAPPDRPRSRVGMAYFTKALTHRTEARLLTYSSGCELPLKTHSHSFSDCPRPVPTAADPRTGWRWA